MTRRTRTSGSFENRLDALETPESESSVEVLWRDDRTGALLDSDREPANPTPELRTIIFTETVVMSREQAEKNGCDILGPAENVPAGRDAVRVLPNV